MTATRMNTQVLYVAILSVLCALAILGQVNCFSPTISSTTRRSLNINSIPTTNHYQTRIVKGRSFLASSKNDAIVDEKNPFPRIQELLSTTPKAATTVTTTITPTQESKSIFDESSAFTNTNDSNQSSFSYNEFAKQYPFINNVGIATIKTGSADFMAQTVIGGTPLLELDLERSFLFMIFGGLYSGCFQWVYQVQIFKRLFDVDKFTSQSWAEKLEDKEGLKQLAMQTALDLTVLTLVYLPTFYVFKAGVFSGSSDPSVWFTTGIDNYVHNFSKDEADALKVWFPADLLCFSVPLYLRLPVRHAISFLWTTYLSFSRGGH